MKLSKWRLRWLVSRRYLTRVGMNVLRLQSEQHVRLGMSSWAEGFAKEAQS
jgi:hypothetical protein